MGLIEERGRDASQERGRGESQERGGRSLSEILREVKKPEIRSRARRGEGDAARDPHVPPPLTPTPPLVHTPPMVHTPPLPQSALPFAHMAPLAHPAALAVPARAPPSATLHECHVCGKTFSRPSGLNTHALIHTGHQPFVCDVPHCGKRFNVKSNLIRHKKIHDKPRD
ncbi:KLTH0H08800p [Lachancea thermotolerans CBS 6340]|uniref:KLTH0H08800p n=1 Tax=Lachancea thermotolerans (strain ATCC 56472 / CBS 6340 / NRRL Y-8284) TaxID=559295 RepID=C5E2Y4_LACTC|nr:KLTH0H08800p [Lachancea thermotolerans CBS 6340]CAR30395.1 KLTH0H08800p [Lachancea thermotolerans CBS 6340]